MSKVTSKPGPMIYPVPMVMVSCGNEEANNIITIGWTGIVNTEPPMTYVSVRKERFSHDLIAESGEFVINLVTEDLTRAADYCGVRSGSKVDKWAETQLTREKADQVSAPMLAESPVNLECRVHSVTELPTHDMFLAEIVAVHIDEEYVSEKGAYEFEKMQLVASNHGGYYGLKDEPVGSFGYSVMKAKTAKRKQKEAAAQRRAGKSARTADRNRKGSEEKSADKSDWKGKSKSGKKSDWKGKSGSGKKSDWKGKSGSGKKSEWKSKPKSGEKSEWKSKPKSGEKSEWKGKPKSGKKDRMGKPGSDRKFNRKTAPSRKREK